MQRPAWVSKFLAFDQRAFHKLLNGTTFSVGLSDDTHLDDLEDIYLAEQALERLRRGGDEVVSAEAFWRGL
ncbi:DNA-binding protein [Spiribacter roseus]|uniref:DNA-binding protein n=1 Tax=Spiribacter roseus TaxID=1855875 RepID=UPI0013300EC3|nr:DNA-binding protein [Spiribacter roseus]KAF0283207.1 hypothetical protein BA898_05095 [Spiribacter roseus]